MSTHAKQKRLTTASIKQMKGGARIVCLTAYTTPIARLLDPHCDLLLVGDSVGMVLYGMDTTVGVTTDMMIAHGRAVMRGVEHACVIVDLPFGTYQESKEQAFRNAVRLMQETGCDGVKLEGGEEMAETIAFLVARGIPVFGHVGLMPQLVHTAGSFRSLGHSDAETQKIWRDAIAVDQAGAFAIVVEGTVEPLARELTENSPSRLSASAHHQPAMGRCWFPTTCSVSSPISNRNSSNVSPIWVRPFHRQQQVMPKRCAPARFRGRSIRFRSVGNRLRRSEERRR